MSVDRAIDKVAGDLIAPQGGDSAPAAQIKHVVETRDTLGNAAHGELPHLLGLPVPAEQAACVVSVFAPAVERQPDTLRFHQNRRDRPALNLLWGIKLVR